MSIRTFSFPTPIHFGAGARHRVADHLKSLGFHSPLVVTDKGVAELKFFKDFVAELQKAGLKVSVFSGVWGNPVVSQVTAGVAAFKDYQSDSMIGIGGGAALDVAKAILVMATHSGHLFDYEDEKPGAKNIENKIPYWVAIPTTAGTGSEVGRSSVISDDKTHIKKIIFSPYLLARSVFADPELTVELPPAITASTGMDALTHLVEAYLAKGFHPLCDGLALEGIRLAAQSLLECYKNPTNLDARGKLLMASMMGAIAFQKGLGVVHSCAHSLSAVTDMHHGLANAIMIDHALKWNISVVPERFTEMAHCAGIKDPSPEKFIHWLAEMKKSLAIPAKLSAAGVKKEQIESLVDTAIQDGCHGSNPRPVTKEDFRRLFNEAF